jgi:hypothetical protein
MLSIEIKRTQKELNISKKTIKNLMNTFKELLMKMARTRKKTPRRMMTKRTPRMMVTIKKMKRKTIRLTTKRKMRKLPILKKKINQQPPRLFSLMSHVSQLSMFQRDNFILNLITSQDPSISSITTTPSKSTMNLRRMDLTQECLLPHGSCTINHSLSQELEDTTWFNNIWTYSNTSKTTLTRTS